MERRVRGNSHARCGGGEKAEIASKPYLFLSNDPGTYEAAREAALEGPESLEDFVESFVIPEDSSLAADLLETALANVDWQEITEALTEE